MAFSVGDEVVIKATGERAEVVDVNRDDHLVKLRLLQTQGFLWLHQRKVRPYEGGDGGQ